MGQVIQTNGDYKIKVGENGIVFIDANGGVGSVNVLGLISVKGTDNYTERLLDDDDIPNKKYVDLLVGTDVEHSIFVAKNGDDTKGGRTLATAKLTIKSALDLAKFLSSPVTVFVYPGIYEEDGELEIPEDGNIIGVGGQYVTEIHATAGNETKNMFLVNSGCYIQGFSFRKQQIDNYNDPSGGFAVAFAPGATIIRSPYIRDISQISNYGKTAVAAPLDPIPDGFSFDDSNPSQIPNPLVGRGGGVLLADRAVLNPDSIFPYMLAFGATPRSPNGIGYVAKNGAGINGISSISIFQQCSFYALNGGQITLNNSGTQFGDISLRAKGSTPVVRPLNADTNSLYKIPIIGDLILTNSQNIIDEMWQDLISVYPIFDSPNENFEELTYRDAGKLLESIAFDYKAGTDTVTKSFVLSLFDYKADYVFRQDFFDGFIRTFEFIRTKIIGIISLATEELSPQERANGIDMINAIVGAPGSNSVLIGTLEQKDSLKFNFSSLIESLGHQFNNAGAGVNKNSLPLNFRRPGQNQPVPFSILEQDGGQVRWSGADEFNNQYFAGGTKINGVTGKFEGRPFDAAVRQIARRLSNSRAML